MLAQQWEGFCASAVGGGLWSEGAWLRRLRRVAKLSSTIFASQDSNSVITTGVRDALPRVRMTIDRCGTHLWPLQLITALGPLLLSSQPSGSSPQLPLSHPSLIWDATA